MENKYITIIAIVIGIITSSFLFLYKEKNNEVNNSVIIFNNAEFEEENYYLYSDLEYDYYVKNYSPINIYAIIKKNNRISSYQITQTIENFKKSAKNSYEDDNLRIDNILKLINTEEIYVTNIDNQIEIIKKQHNKNKYTLKKYTLYNSQDYEMYFIDKNNVNIYIKGIKEIFFEYNNVNYELKDLLKMNNDSFYMIFNELKNESSSIIFYDNDVDTLQTIIKDNLQITLKVVDEQLNFYIEECKEEVIEDITIMKK